MTVTRSKSLENRQQDHLQTSSADLLHARGGITRPRTAHRQVLTSAALVTSDLVSQRFVSLTPQIEPSPSRQTTPVPVPQQQQPTPEHGSVDTSPYKKRFGDTYDGYIEHNILGLVMHPSFFDDKSRGFTLCTNIRTCRHEDDCYEIRKRMAVFACMRGLSYRESAYLWRVSKSTLQREIAENGNRISLRFLVVPKKE